MIANGTPFYPSPYGSTPFPNLANHFLSLRPPTISSYYHPNITSVRKAQPTPPKHTTNPPNPPKVPSFKLYDLDTSKQSDLIRFIFNFAGVPLKDKKMKFDEWEKTKTEFQLDQLPILRVNHQLKIYYLDPILRFLAREFHLYGTGEHEHLIVDMVLESIRSLHTQLLGQSTDDALRQWLTTEGTTHLKRLENLHHVFNRQPPFYLGSHISIADLIIFFILESLIKVQGDVLQSYPHLRQAYRRLEKHPQMANYLRSKPKETLKALEKPRQETRKSPTPPKSSHRHRSTSKQHRHRSTSKQNHHHHHHHHHRHESKEPTPTVQNKQTSTSPTVQAPPVVPVATVPPPPPPPASIATVAPPALPEIKVA